MRCVSASLPSLEPEGAGQGSCALFAQGWLCPAPETLVRSRWGWLQPRLPAPSQSWGVSCLSLTLSDLCLPFSWTGSSPLISSHIASWGVAMSFWDPVPMGRLGGHISELGSSEALSELCQTENEKTLSELPLEDGSCTYKKGIGWDIF